MKRATLVLAAGGALAASTALSFVHPWGNLRTGAQASATLLEGRAVPAEVRHVLEKKCADCHSNNTRWPAYSRLAPGSWLMEHDVHEAREHLNLSRWQQYSPESQIDLLSKIASVSRSGQMPVRQYLILHPSARLSADEQSLIYDWAKSERKRVRQQRGELQSSTFTK